MNIFLCLFLYDSCLCISRNWTNGFRLVVWRWPRKGIVVIVVFMFFQKWMFIAPIPLLTCYCHGLVGVFGHYLFYAHKPIVTNAPYRPRMFDSNLFSRSITYLKTFMLVVTSSSLNIFSWYLHTNSCSRVHHTQNVDLFQIQIFVFKLQC